MFIYLIIVVINLSVILIFLYYNLLIQNLNKQVNYDLKSWSYKIWLSNRIFLGFMF